MNLFYVILNLLDCLVRNMMTPITISAIITTEDRKNVLDSSLCEKVLYEHKQPLPTDYLLLLQLQWKLVSLLFHNTLFLLGNSFKHLHNNFQSYHQV